MGMATLEDRDTVEDPGERLEATNVLLAEWAACSAEESAPLIERFEALGYAVRGKSREEIAEVLRHPPGHS